MSRRCACAALVTAGLLLVPSAALAVEITSPTNQSGVTGGTTVTVSGADCPPGAAVRVFFVGAQEQGVSTTADARSGAWSVGLPVPISETPAVEESSERSIEAECAGERASVVVAYDGPGAGELPYTGSGTAAAAAGLGGALVLLGVGAVCAGRRRGTHRAGT